MFLFDKHRPLVNIARRYLWSVPAVTVLGLISTGLEGIGVGLIAPLVVSLTSSESAASSGPFRVLMQFGADLPANTRLVYICAGIAGLVILKNAVAFLNTLLISFVDGRASHDVRVALAHQLLTVEYGFFLVEPPGRIINILANESWRASEAIRAFFQALSSAASLILFGIFLLWSEWRLGLAVGLGVLAIRHAIARITRRVNDLSSQMSAENESLASAMMISVLAMRPIRIFGQEAREEARFRDASEKVRALIFAMERKSALIQPLSESLRTCVLVLLLAGTVRVAADVPLPVLATFLVLLQRTQPHLATFEAARAKISQTSGAVQEVEWLLAVTRKAAPRSLGQVKPSFDRDIRFADVSFRYHSSSEIRTIDSASFVIRAGSSTALIGPSGSGKSTIINLLCGLLEPTSGEILVDGTSLDRLDRSEWLNLIGIAGQDTEIIEGTIAENIAYGAPHVGQAEIEEAARVADADAFVRSLPLGYATNVGSRGLNLSGGQRQRIGLARAIVRKPRLLILDEATSAVDGLSERTIMDLLASSRRSCTMLVVSHRMSTLSRCDSAIVLEGGRVVRASPMTDVMRDREAIP
ncbi:ABC transporter ATP-binding protein [Methylobacterium sp. WSM2598]|uniref:ABC transporter ATP-binding protein n=1 Tax=Methylobacterium sp. WSM2598 TaxID=398261 RepID=UPI00036337C6|nr:ABC transporter ATP-binding protein [Methylobacterium sp. WSM2598]